eukprot:TRINITY_DN1420_c0_g1_i2.p1 TRINITY_DN1420_c0_g1~~TRINITY_DN1420_c0_g1_i2.p1  ORF type:complete len:1414 (-),score=284.33 TRINITY_DN1420_c0_g1_i2:1283-5524(-)
MDPQQEQQPSAVIIDKEMIQKEVSFLQARLKQEQEEGARLKKMANGEEILMDERQLHLLVAEVQWLASELAASQTHLSGLKMRRRLLLQPPPPPPPPPSVEEAPKAPAPFDPVSFFSRPVRPVERRGAMGLISRRHSLTSIDQISMRTVVDSIKHPTSTFQQFMGLGGQKQGEGQPQESTTPPQSKPPPKRQGQEQGLQLHPGEGQHSRVQPPLLPHGPGRPPDDLRQRDQIQFPAAAIAREKGHVLGAPTGALGWQGAKQSQMHGFPRLPKALPPKGASGSLQRASTAYPLQLYLSVPTSSELITSPASATLFSPSTPPRPPASPSDTPPLGTSPSLKVFCDDSAVGGQRVIGFAGSRDVQRDQEASARLPGNRGFRRTLSAPLLPSEFPESEVERRRKPNPWLLRSVESQVPKSCPAALDWTVGTAVATGGGAGCRKGFGGAGEGQAQQQLQLQLHEELQKALTQGREVKQWSAEAVSFEGRERESPTGTIRDAGLVLASQKEEGTECRSMDSGPSLERQIHASFPATPSNSRRHEDHEQLCGDDREHEGSRDNRETNFDLAPALPQRQTSESESHSESLRICVDAPMGVYSTSAERITSRHAGRGPRKLTPSPSSNGRPVFDTDSEDGGSPLPVSRVNTSGRPVRQNSLPAGAVTLSMAAAATAAVNAAAASTAAARTSLPRGRAGSSSSSNVPSLSRGRSSSVTRTRRRSSRSRDPGGGEEEGVDPSNREGASSGDSGSMAPRWGKGSGEQASREIKDTSSATSSSGHSWRKRIFKGARRNSEKSDPVPLPTSTLHHLLTSVPDFTACPAELSEEILRCVARQYLRQVSSARPVPPTCPTSGDDESEHGGDSDGARPPPVTAYSSRSAASGACSLSPVASTVSGVSGAVSVSSTSSSSTSSPYSFSSFAGSSRFHRRHSSSDDCPPIVPPLRSHSLFSDPPPSNITHQSGWKNKKRPVSSSSSSSPCSSFSPSSFPSPASSSSPRPSSPGSPAGSSLRFPAPPPLPRHHSSRVVAEVGLADEGQWLGQGVMDPYRVLNGHPNPEGLLCPGVLEFLQPPRRESALYSPLDADRYKALLAQLDAVDPAQMSNSEKLAFWLNTYNAVLMQAYVEHGATTSAEQWHHLISTLATCRVGGRVLSAMEIEAAVLVGLFNPSSTDTEVQLKASGEHLNPVEARGFCASWCLDAPEPLSAFGLCGGTFLATPLRVFHAHRVRPMLEQAFYDYVAQAVAFVHCDPPASPGPGGGATELERQQAQHEQGLGPALVEDGRLLRQATLGLPQQQQQPQAEGLVQLPPPLHWYGSTLSKDDHSLLAWLSTHLPPKCAHRLWRLTVQATTLQLQTQQKSPRQPGKAAPRFHQQLVLVAPPDWTFRYLLDIQSITNHLSHASSLSQLGFRSIAGSHRSLADDMA